MTTVDASAELGDSPDEDARVRRLLDAQAKAEQLFAEITERGMIRPGVGERELSNEIRDLAADMFGVTRHWHKRIVRAGENTLQTYRANPPDHILTDDEILFLDFGPIFEEWEADFGRTFVLGDDPTKHALRASLSQVWEAGREHFRTHPYITGAQLYDRVVELSREAGWEFGGDIAGHLVGEFPHESIDAAEIESYIAPGSDGPMRRTDRAGRQCHWILEVHLVTPDRRFGGFCEELLDLP
ncbi:M24 family metallopeptidase [Gordonia polyisoprenivorans]|uniref:M24 family metallopeptidase n=1 Tax=Gordonia polyisoprenivorans TaxID=84595 RepID=UPI001AD69FC2|nr:M24 family metallopeptidase [Gordonia polyisoprenivorans]QTI68400.1 aminopeptidase P family protein [Gordonia polyisoprenivorans]